MQVSWDVPSGEYTLAQARSFLREDFLKVAQRTRFLYVQAPQHADLGFGFFEPVLLALCWCDFLGALYTGKGTIGTSTERSRRFIAEVLGGGNPKFPPINTAYQAAARVLVKIYRNGTAHAYAPNGFDLALSDQSVHLQPRGSTIGLSIEHLLLDMIAATESFAAHIEDGRTSEGTLVALNTARSALRAQ